MCSLNKVYRIEFQELSVYNPTQFRVFPLDIFGCFLPVICYNLSVCVDQAICNFNRAATSTYGASVGIRKRCSFLKAGAGLHQSAWLVCEGRVGFQPTLSPLAKCFLSDLGKSE